MQEEITKQPTTALFTISAETINRFVRLYNNGFTNEDRPYFIDTNKDSKSCWIYEELLNLCCIEFDYVLPNSDDIYTVLRYLLHHCYEPLSPYNTDEERYKPYKQSLIERYFTNKVEKVDFNTGSTIDDMYYIFTPSAFIKVFSDIMHTIGYSSHINLPRHAKTLGIEFNSALITNFFASEGLIIKPITKNGQTNDYLYQPLLLDNDEKFISVRSYLQHIFLERW